MRKCLSGQNPAGMDEFRGKKVLVAEDISFLPLKGTNIVTFSACVYVGKSGKSFDTKCLLGKKIKKTIFEIEEDAFRPLKEAAMDAEELFSLDELEEHARKMRGKK